MTTAAFRGLSGRTHSFAVFRPQDVFPPEAAVYGFARPGFSGRGWVVVFLSRTANLEARLCNHERWDEARRLGATHVLVHQREERDARELVEADLLESLRPIMNEPVVSDAAPSLRASAEEEPVWSPHSGKPAERPRPRLVWAA